LKFLAYLALDFISIKFLKAGSDGIEDDLKHVITDDECFDEAVSLLEQFSLVKRENSKHRDVLVMHRLVQAFLQDEIQMQILKETEIQRQWAM